MLMRRLKSFLLLLSAFVIPVSAGDRPKTETTAEVLSRLSDYKNWSQVNRFDGEGSGRSFMIERSWAGGG